MKGISGADRITKFDVSKMTSQIACEVKGFDPRAFGLTEYEATSMDRHAQFAIAAANQAVEDAGLDVSKLDRERVSVYVGSTNSAPETFEGAWERLTDRGATSLIGKALPPEFYFGVLSNASATGIAIHYGFMGRRP